MDSSDSIPCDSGKSKKAVPSSPQSKPSRGHQMAKSNPDRSSWIFKTPDKPENPSRRVRNRRAVLSLKEVREVAKQLQESDQNPCRRPDPLGCGAPQMGLGQSDSQIRKRKKIDEQIELPEKLDLLGKFFDNLDSSIRLLRLKGSMSTFTNICPKIEYLTDRRFTYAHLAQLKHILPEVFEMKKILIHDEKTSCMKPDIHITLNIDAINNDVEQNDGKQKLSGNLIMRKVFRARLLEFFRAHPEGEVPEAVLPEPFNQSKKDVIQSNPLATPRKETDSLKNEVCSSMVTPAKLVSTPLRLMSATPASQPPKRCCMSPDDSSTSSPCKLVRRAPRSRSLKFDSPQKNVKTEVEHNDMERLSIDNDILDVLPQNLLQSIREKERKALEEQDPATIEAKRRQKMIAGLPKLFDMIHFLFQSINRSVITKEEFMHKLLSNHLGITDRSETEEQLKLLRELVPGWIYEKLASSGDLLICINKMSNPELMRARLEEAK